MREALVPGASGLTAEDRELQQVIASFATNELNEGLVERDAAHEFNREGWRKCAELGLQGLPVPDSYGGGGAGALTTAAAMVGLGYGCHDNGLIFAINAHMWACQTPIMRFGSEELKQRYLPALCDGTLIAAHGMTEPATGSDAFALTTSATRTDNGWVLNGQKTFVTNAPVADVFILFATTDVSLGFAGLCAFVVERDTPGLLVGKPIAKMGLHTSPMSEVFLDNCEVADETLLGEVGGGMPIFNSSMRWERALILAASVGTMQRHLEVSTAYARERRQFGTSIGSFQAVSHRLVDMRLRLDTSRLLLYETARLLDSGKSADVEAALTKIHLSDNFVHSATDALELHGGYGYTAEYGFERDVRDAFASRLYSGTTDMQRNLVASHLGL